MLLSSPSFQSEPRGGSRPIEAPAATDEPIGAVDLANVGVGAFFGARAAVLPAAAGSHDGAVGNMIFDSASLGANAPLPMPIPNPSPAENVIGRTDGGSVASWLRYAPPMLSPTLE
jgi:hypothetical protein